MFLRLCVYKEWVPCHLHLLQPQSSWYGLLNSRGGPPRPEMCVALTLEEDSGGSQSLGEAQGATSEPDNGMGTRGVATLVLASASLVAM